MGWIKCTERLPPAWTTVLCYTYDIVLGEIDRDGIWVELPYHIDIRPTHWMSLPNIPKEKE
jgi:hypothetical protein